MTKWEKKKKDRQLPEIILTGENLKAYEYCVRNNIRISPVGILGEVGKWRIGISTPESYKKVYESPEICDKYTVWEVFNRYTKYYYDRETI